MYSISLNRIPSDFNRLFSVVAGVQPGQIYLLSGPPRLLGQVAQAVLDRVAIRTPVRVVIGGNRFSLEGLPLLLEEQGGRIYEILNQLTLTRAETCYQMVDALHKTVPTPTPIFITDLLTPFYDEGISDQEAARLVAKCAGYLRDFGRRAPVVVSAAQEPPRPELFHLLKEVCDQQLHLIPEEDPGAVQAALW